MRGLPLVLVLLHLLGEQAMAGALERAMLGKSSIVDLTHPLDERPASPPAQERLRQETAGDGERNTPGQRLAMPADLNTHLEAPVVVVNGKPTVAQIPPRDLLVNAVVVDIAARVAKTADYQATVEDLQVWEQQNGRIPKGSAVLLHTGWARRRSDRARYLNLDSQGVPHVPGFSRDALTFLASQRDVRGIGLDAFVPSVSSGAGGDGGRPLLQAGKWQLVNLTNLNRLPAKGAKLVIAPLRVEAGSAPARVIAILP
jgi:kynurenine formamidase